MKKVGFFDSGIGGVSIAREFLRRCPQADVLYVADWEYCPYGEKGDNIVLERSIAITRQLIEQGCSIVVLACNSASAVALKPLREMFPTIAFVGMEPAIKPAAVMTSTGIIGLLATKHTLAGELLRNTTGKYAPNMKIVASEGSGFVELVESGDLTSSHARRVVESVLQPLLNANCDPIILGCTHYPFLLPLMQSIAPTARFLDPAPAIATRIETLLTTD